MRRTSSTSVRVFYPKLNTQDAVAHLKSKVNRLEKLIPLKILALFGSYARGNYTVASDVDVLVIYEGPRNENLYNKIWDLLYLPHLELHLYSESEYLALKSTIDRMKREGIIIFEGA